MPYMACEATNVARRFACAVFQALFVANRVFASAKAARQLSLIFPPLGGAQRLRLLVDASNFKNGVLAAHTGCAVFSTSATVERGPLPPAVDLSSLLYMSHLQRRVTHSSFSVEAYALLEGVRAFHEVAAIQAQVRTTPIYPVSSGYELYR